MMPNNQGHPSAGSGQALGDAARPQEIVPIERKLAGQIGILTLQLLERSNMLNDPASGDVPTIYAWPFAERVALIIDPMRVRNINAVLSPRFQHHLATALAGRRVVMTNHRGIILQVGYWPEPARALSAKPLDLAQQPSPLHVPIGATARRDLWLPIDELDAVLIGGARRMGKTNLLHGWITTLLQGKETRLVLYDGKGGVEFNRYAGSPRCQVVDGKLGPVLGELVNEMHARFDALKKASVANLAEYNARRGAGGRIERIVLIVDELAYALEESGVEDVLVDLIARGGAVGIHPVLATQRPSADVVTPRLKGNLVTRIALPVPDRASSMVILDRGGAERLAKMPGRLLLLHGARWIEAQAFQNKAEAAPPLRHHAPRLDDREARLARAVIEQLDGWFVTQKVMAVTGERDVGRVNAMARRWELLGYLTPVQKNARGYSLGRRATDRLRQALGVESGESANGANQGE